jgi:hypothetical protein
MDPGSSTESHNVSPFLQPCSVGYKREDNIELVRLKTVRLETAKAIADALFSLGYMVHVRPGPLDLAHILTDSDTYIRLRATLDSLIMDDERWITDCRSEVVIQRSNSKG